MAAGWFGTYWHILLPFIKRELWLIGLLSLMGTSVLLATPLVVFDGGFLTQWLAWLLPTWQGGLAPTRNIGLMMGASLVATLPVILIFFLMKHYLQSPTPAGRDARSLPLSLPKVSRPPVRTATAGGPPTKATTHAICRYFARTASISISTATSLPIIQAPPVPCPIPKSLRLSGAVVTRQRVVGFLAADSESPSS